MFPTPQTGEMQETVFDVILRLKIFTRQELDDELIRLDGRTFWDKDPCSVGRAIETMKTNGALTENDGIFKASNPHPDY